MKKINELYDLPYDTELNDIKINSKEVEKGDIFVCIKGVNADRHDFIDEAIANGAALLIVKKEGSYSIPYIKVDNPNEELVLLAQKFYDYPSQKLKLIGVTGTDGKTTTSMIIRDLLGIDICGYIGTNGVLGKKLSDKTSNTTPECHLIYKYLYFFIQEGLEYASMETSSEAFYRGRLDSFTFDIGILTNVTEDHLNIHKTLDNYIASKQKLFTKIKKDGVAILNIDDKYYDSFKDIHKNVLTYGKNNHADLCIKEISEKDNSTKIIFKYHNHDYETISPLLGEFNVYNLAASILALIALGFNMDDIISRVKNIKVPSGRCEFLDYGTPYKIVLDYAHTPNGLLSILNYLNKIKKGRIITVVGSAGGREKEKRKDMGKIVLNLSNLVIFTMDDPRNENPKDIIQEMIDKNIGNYEIIIDRSAAIRHALSVTNENDIVLIAGKGRDNYMAIGNKYVPYCDADVIDKYFKENNDK